MIPLLKPKCLTAHWSIHHHSSPCERYVSCVYVAIPSRFLFDIPCHTHWLRIYKLHTHQHMNEQLLTTKVLSEISFSIRGTILKLRNSGTSFSRNDINRNRLELSKISSDTKLNSSWSCSRRKNWAASLRRLPPSPWKSCNFNKYSKLLKVQSGKHSIMHFM